MIAKYYPYLDNLVSIRRSTASVLKTSEDGEDVSLKSMMPKHKVETVELKFNDEEAIEHQWFHRVHARYVTILILRRAN